MWHLRQFKTNDTNHCQYRVTHFCHVQTHTSHNLNGLIIRVAVALLIYHNSLVMELMQPS